MRSTRIRIANVLVLAVLSLALVGPTTAQTTDPAGGLPAALDQPMSLVPTGKAALHPRAATLDMGEPAPADAATLDAVRRVLTDPGDLPQLEVKMDGETLQLPLQHTHVSAELSGFVARVEVTQLYRNPLDEPIEAVYVFPLPENSAVDDMKIRIGDRLIEAEIQRRADARRTYETAKREGYTAALLEQERPSVFTQSIANMEPGKDIEVIIRYVQDLTYDAGEYEFVFPMVVGPRFIPGNPKGATGTGWSPDTDEVPDASRITPPIVGGGMRSGHDISIDVTIAPGLSVADFDVPTHEVNAAEVDGAMVIELSPKDSLPNRDFVLRYRADQPLPQGAVLAHREKRGGFFSLVVQPPTLDVDALLGKREIIFVIDISGSMYGVPLGMAKEAARTAIANLRPVDTFNVITFAGHTAKAFPSPYPANTTNVREALKFVDEARAGGGTYLANAVQAALSPEVEDGRNRYVVFLTDGYVGNESAILAGIETLVQAHAKKGQKARAFGFGVGSSVNRMLMNGIGKAGNGATVYLTTREDPARATQTMFRMIDHPILTDVKIDWGELEVRDVEPQVIPDLIASRPLILHGRYKRGGKGEIKVSGWADGHRMEVRIPVDLPSEESRNGALETLWARARIDSLSRALWGGEKPDVVEQITELGLDYRIVTAYTSFVAVDRSKKVSDGDIRTMVQPVETPEGVDATTAAPPGALYGYGGATGTVQGFGGMSSGGAGRGGGGVGHGSLRMMTRTRKVRAPAAVAPKAEPARMQFDEDAAPQEQEPTATAGAESRPDGAATSGYLSSAEVKRVLRRHAKGLRALYEKRATEVGGLGGGTFKVRLTVTADGRVSKVELLEDPFGDKTFAGRLARFLKKLRFAASGGPTTITLPIAFAK